MQSLRSSGHLLQLLPKPALPQVPGKRTHQVAGCAFAELLAVPYFHVVFTLPHELSVLVLQNKRLLYDLLFRTSAATMLEVARDRSISEPTSVYSVCFTPGDRTCNITLMSIASFLLAG